MNSRLISLWVASETEEKKLDFFRICNRSIGPHRQKYSDYAFIVDRDPFLCNHFPWTIPSPDLPGISSLLCGRGLAPAAKKAAPPPYTLTENGGATDPASLPLLSINLKVVLKPAGGSVGIYVSADRSTSSPDGLPQDPYQGPI